MVEVAVVVVVAVAAGKGRSEPLSLEHAALWEPALELGQQWFGHLPMTAWCVSCLFSGFRTIVVRFNACCFLIW